MSLALLETIQRAGTLLIKYIAYIQDLANNNKNHVNGSNKISLFA
jgi:hypothetical protein